MLSPGELMPAEACSGFAELSPDEVTARVGDVGVTDAKDEIGFSFKLREEVEGMGTVLWGRAGRVGARIGAQSPTMHVCGEVADCSGNALIELRR